MHAGDDLNVPDAHFFMFDRLVAFDHKEQRCWIMVCPAARKTALGYAEVPETREARLSAEKDLDGLAAGAVILLAFGSFFGLNVSAITSPCSAGRSTIIG